MIPKIIHYCWFGRNEKSSFIKKCINSWGKYCPDYKIVEWNEDTFDVTENPYVKEAYEKKKWAFVSDYVRLYAINKFGGFYLDTDVELIKSLDSFIMFHAVMGYESRSSLLTALIGAEKNNSWINDLLSYYDGRHFIDTHGVMDITTNVVTISEIARKKYAIPFDNKFFEIPDVLTIFPKDYFSPKSPGAKRYFVTGNTVAIHHFDASWMDGNRRVNQFKMRYSRLLGICKNSICFFIGRDNFEKLRGRKKV